MLSAFEDFNIPGFCNFIEAFLTLKSLIFPIVCHAEDSELSFTLLVPFSKNNELRHEGDEDGFPVDVISKSRSLIDLLTVNEPEPGGDCGREGYTIVDK